MFILDPPFFHFGSRIRTVSIPDPGSASKNLSIVSKTMVSNSVADPDPGSGIRCFLTPGSGMGESEHPDPGSGMNNPDHIF